MANLIQSIDYLIQKKIENLPYDITWICTITDDTNRSEGEYKVKHEVVEFTAYSELRTLRNDQQVYVCIPKGDTSEIKLITGAVPLKEEQIAETLDILDYVKSKDVYSSPEEKIYSILVSNESSEDIIITQALSQEIIGYTLINIQGKFKTSMSSGTKVNNYGNYGIAILLYGYNTNKTTQRIENSEANLVKTIYLDSDSMVGTSLYNSGIFSAQLTTEDIENLVIKRIGIKLYQRNFNLEQRQDSVVPAQLAIYVSDIHLSCGYEESRYNEKNELLYIYSDSLLYNSLSSTNRNIYYRFMRNGKEVPITNTSQIQIYKNNSTESLSNTVIIGGRYSIDSLDTSLEVSEESYKFVYHNTYSLSSNLLVFKNKEYIVNSDVADSLTGFQLNIPSAYNSGIYYIYGKNNFLLDESESFSLKYLYASYTSAANRSRKLRAGDRISWRIPKSSTMIDAPVTEGRTEETNYYLYEKTIAASDLDSDNIFKIPFYISKYYSQNYTNNTVTCTLILNDNGEDGKSFDSQFELTFGYSGSQGTNYIAAGRLYRQFEGEVEEVQAIKINDNGARYYIDIKLYNYNNKEIDNYTVSYDQNLSDIVSMNNSNSKIIEFKQSYAFDDFSKSFILGIEVAPDNSNDKKIKYYFPVALSKSIDYIYQGPSSVIYDENNSNPNYSTVKIKLLEEQATLLKDLNCSIEFLDESGDFGMDRTFGSLVAPSSITKDKINSSIKINLKLGENLLYSQPVYIGANSKTNIQSPQENSATSVGSYTLSSSQINNLVEESSKYSGMYIGQVGANKGLYGFQESNKIFSLDKNGVFYLVPEEENTGSNSKLLCKDSSSSITTLTISAGSSKKGIYIDNGVIKPMDSTIGSTDTPVFLNQGEITQVTSLSTDLIKCVDKDGKDTTLTELLVDILKKL